MEEQTKHKYANNGRDDPSLRKINRSADLNVTSGHLKKKIFMTIQGKNSGPTLKTTSRDTKLCGQENICFFLNYD